MSKNKQAFRKVIFAHRDSDVVSERLRIEHGTVVMAALMSVGPTRQTTTLHVFFEGSLAPEAREVAYVAARRLVKFLERQRLSVETMSDWLSQDGREQGDPPRVKGFRARHIPHRDTMAYFLEVAVQAVEAALHMPGAGTSAKYVCDTLGSMCSTQREGLPTSADWVYRDQVYERLFWERVAPELLPLYDEGSGDGEQVFLDALYEKLEREQDNATNKRITDFWRSR